MNRSKINWEAHLNAWGNSNQSRRAYCLENKLNYTTFLRKEKIKSDEVTPAQKDHKLIPVRVKHSNYENQPVCELKIDQNLKLHVQFNISLTDLFNLARNSK